MDDDERLISDYLDGQSSPEDLARLQRRLVESPAAADHFVQLANVDSDLDLVLRRRAGKAVSTPRRWVRPLAIAATALAAGAITVVFLWRGNESLDKTVVTTRPPTPDEPPPAIAKHPERRGLFWEGEPPGLRRSETLMSSDFEHPAPAQPAWRGAGVVACPPGGGHRHCLQSKTWGQQRQLGVTLGDWRNSFLRYTPDLHLQFDYWIGQTTAPTKPRIRVAIQGAGRTYVLDIDAAREGTWVRVTAALSSARYYGEGALADGEAISAIHLNFPWSRNDVFYVDNISLARYAAP